MGAATASHTRMGQHRRNGSKNSDLILDEQQNKIMRQSRVQIRMRKPKFNRNQALAASAAQIRRQKTQEKPGDDGLPDDDRKLLKDEKRLQKVHEIVQECKARGVRFMRSEF